MGNLYSVAFSSVNATGVAKELFEIIGSTLSSFRVWGLTIGQIAAALSSSAIETLTVGLWRGSTVGSSGTAVTPIRLNARSSATASFTALINSSALGATAASAQLVLAKVWNTQNDFVWQARADGDIDERPVCILGQRLHVRLGAPAGTIALGGTLLIEEIGRLPGSTVK